MFLSIVILYRGGVRLIIDCEKIFPLLFYTKKKIVNKNNILILLSLHPQFDHKFI
jgi:hypothetical protein